MSELTAGLGFPLPLSFLEKFYFEAKDKDEVVEE